MHQRQDPALVQYPHGRGYGHDYMRGGEVLGGYGYAARAEYEAPLGELMSRPGGGSTDSKSTEQDSSP